jgi:hypothetical protein
MGNFLKKVLPYAAGALAGGVSNQFSALKPFSAAISAGAGALTNSKNRIGGALQGFAGGGVGSAIGGGVTSKNGFGEGAMAGLKTYGNSIPGFGGVGTANPTGAMAKFFTPQSIQNPTSKFPMSPIGGGTNVNSMSVGDQTPAYKPFATAATTPAFNTAGAVGAPAAAASGSIQNKSLIDKLFSGGKSLMQGAGNTAQQGGANWLGAAAGAALPMAVSAMTPDVEAPDFSSISDPLKQQVMNSKNPDALAFYKQQLGAQGVDSTPGLAVDKRTHDLQLQDNLRSFDQQWKASMGGQDMTNNSEYQAQRQKIIQDAERNWTANQSQFQFQYDQAQQQQKYAAAAALQGMDDSQLNALAGLAQYDLMTIMTQFQMDATSAQQIQELAATASSLIMQKSLGLTGAAQTPVKAA